jgi:hypothetical protein
VISAALIERRSPSGLKHLCNNSSLFRYIFDNLRVSANWAKGWRRNTDERPGPDGTAKGTRCSAEEFKVSATQFLLKSCHELELTRHARVILLLASSHRREQGVIAGEVRDVDSLADRAAYDEFSVVHGAQRSRRRFGPVPAWISYRSTAIAPSQPMRLPRRWPPTQYHTTYRDGSRR